MNATSLSPGQPSAEGARLQGLAIASLVLGILGLLTSLFIVGGLLALPGLVLGIIYLRRQTGWRRMAWTGVSLSVVAILVAGSVLSLLWSAQRFSRSAGSGSGTGFEAWYGKEAPELEVTTLDGAVLQISGLRGRRVILEFWATWEKSSKAKVPALIRLQQENPDDLVIVGISGEDAAVLRSYATDAGINYHVVSSSRGALPQPYSDIRRLPTTFFLDRQGIIQHVSVGSRDYERLRRYAVGPDYSATAPSKTAR
jgi:thiol-disulfide isomerase/thioredoxin